MRAADYLLPRGPLARAFPSYEHRPSQLSMAEAVQDTLEGSGVLLVEAGTGTGKTLAYLLPALLTEQRVVVSTGTKNLQDQIMESDLPMLERTLGVEAHAECMKGLSNYVCLRRLGETRRSADAAQGKLARELEVVNGWLEGTETGDRAELGTLSDSASVWSRVTSSPETRVGARCEHYDDCYVTRMRRRAEEAQLIVVNHHLFFADLATRGPHGGGVIPDYDAVVFDEAHQIEDVVTQFFGMHISSTRIDVLCRDAQGGYRAARQWDAGAPLVAGVTRAAGAFFGALPGSPGDTGRQALARDAFSGELQQCMFSLDAALEALGANAKLRAGDVEGLTSVAKRAGQVRDDLAAIAEAKHGTHVAWTQRQGRFASVGASPIDVSELMREHLFFRTPSVVLTSATLSTGGNMKFIKRRLGIDFDAREELLDSPFDYDRQAALYLAGHLPDPRDPEYLDEATSEVESLVEVTGGGAFVLCTSYRVMHELAERCQLDHPAFVQGDAPKATLLSRFREAHDGVLFATASFWEGVDVPGDALRLVVIDKLPFDVPSDPLVAARCDLLRDEGEQPFMKYLVPSAALSLKQGFGRLIRSATDRGIVAILDRRIVTKGYGKVFLRSLPPARRCESLADVRDFWAGV